jgi:hypothetical protein
VKTYFISDGTCVKIGKSVDPAKRLAQLQTSHSRPLSLVAVLDGDHEAVCHRLFAAFRKTGEWFQLDERHAQLIDALSSTPTQDRCIGVNDEGRRCPRRAQELGFCEHCLVGPHLYLSEASCLLLARSEWETLKEAAHILRRSDLRVD